MSSGPGRLRPGGARVRCVHFPYRHTIKWSDNVPEHGGTYALLTLQTEEGLTGVGEATLKPIWSGSSPRSIVASLEDVLLPRLAGVNLFDAQAVQAALAAVPENMAGKTLIDNACWDLRAQAAGEPLWQLLGGRREVPVSWTLTRAAPEVMVEEARSACAAHGFRTIKMKGGQGIETDVRAVRGVREVLGPEGRLYVDANWQYGREEGLEFARAVAAEGAALVEDPWWLQPDGCFEQASHELPVPLMVDYFCNGSRDAPAWIARGARAFSLKPGRVGLTEACALSSLAEAAGAERITGMFAETQIGSLHSLSFASATGSRFAAETSFFLMFGASPLHEPLQVRAGSIMLPEGPGIAPLVDWEFVERHML